MFEKNNDAKKIEYSNNEFYKIGDVLITPSFGITLNNYYNTRKMQEENDYQDQITSYNKRKYENSIKKLYNPRIVNIYDNGSLIINNKEYSINEFYIVFDDNKNIFHLLCNNPKYENDEFKYNKAVKFKDTTAFINLVNNDKILIIDNKIIINDNNILNDVISKWDGYIHNETKETDAIIDKKIIKDGNNE